MPKLIKMFKGEQGLLPVGSAYGSCPIMEAKENCLVVYPEPEDHSGFIISDSVLEDLGYIHNVHDIDIPVKKYFIAAGKIHIINQKTSAKWIVQQSDKSTWLATANHKPFLHKGKWKSEWLFTDKPSLHIDKQYSSRGLRLYKKNNPYVDHYKKSLRKLHNVYKG